MEVRDAGAVESQSHHIPNLEQNVMNACTLLLLTQGLVHEMVLSTLRVGSPTSINSVKEIFHSPTQLRQHLIEALFQGDFMLCQVVNQN